MSVDTDPWSETPEENDALCGMRLAGSAPVLQTTSMVATLMAAIKTGSLEAALLQEQVSTLEQQVGDIPPVSAILIQQIDALFE